MKCGRLAHLALVLALAGPGAGCARLFGGHDLAPNGLSRQEEDARRMLARGRADSLHAVLSSGRYEPHGDALLTDLYRALAAYHGGRPAESAALLDSAAFQVEERRTRSVSRAAGSLLSSDRTLEWIPGPAERLLVPYYAARARLAQNDLVGAAVEARRLSALLEAEDDPPMGGVPLRAALRYFAGAVFQAAGQWNDAAVAYRNAAALGGGLLPAADALLPAEGVGEVVVILERGFVAHRVQESFTVLLGGDELRTLGSGDAGDRLAAATLVAGRVLAGELDGPRRGRQGRPDRPGRAVGRHDPAPDPCAPGSATGVIRTAATGDTSRVIIPPGATACARDEGNAKAAATEDDDEGSDTPYLLRVAWPTFAAVRGVGGGAMVHVDSASHAPVTRAADVSAAVIADFERDRVALVARTLARAAAKAAVSRGLEKEVAEKDETAGALLGILANVGTALLEHADTRGWNLLPTEIGFARLRLPAGTHELRVTVDGGQILELGPVEVREGGLVIVGTRAW
ncbi:MAG: hypothetical protein WEA24_09105 [Gemmatimonadota bacterium]